MVKIIKTNLLLIGIVLLFVVNNFPISASTQHVIDEMDFLTQEEVAQLEEEIQRIRTDYNTDAVIVITDELNGKTTVAFADDYFDYNNYGIDGEGVLMLIDMQNRQVWISTAGTRTIPLFQPNIDSILDYVTPPLSTQSYYDSCTLFLENMRYILSAGTTTVTGESGLQSSSNNSVNLHYEVQTTTSTGSFFKTPMYVIVAIALGLIIGGIPTAVITFQSKGKNTISNRTYESTNSFNLLRRIDQFTHETITQRTIQTNNNSGGTHRGSSGTSHGGGGRGF